MKNHYYPFAGQVRLKRKASGDNSFETLILAKKVIEGVQEMKRKGSWYLLNGSPVVIKADYPIACQKKDSREHWGKLSHPESQPPGPENWEQVGRQISVVTGRGSCDYPYGNSLSDGLTLAQHIRLKLLTECLPLLISWAADPQAGAWMGWFIWQEQNHTTGIWRLALTLLSNSWAAMSSNLSTAGSDCRLCGLEMQAKKWCGFHIKNFLTHLTTVKAAS